MLILVRVQASQPNLPNYPLCRVRDFGPFQYNRVFDVCIQAEYDAENFPGWRPKAEGGKTQISTNCWTRKQGRAISSYGSVDG
jgi:hypothetical protein